MNAIHHGAARYAALFLVAAAGVIPVVGTPNASARQAADTQTEVDGPNILPNGGFEQGADPGKILLVPRGSTPLLAGWTVANANCDPRSVYYVGTAWQAEEGTRSLAMTNSSSTPSATDPAKLCGIEQSFPTVVGQRYRIVFYQAATPNNGQQPETVEMVVAGQTRQYTFQADAKATAQHMEWVKRTFVVTATAAKTTIGFYAIYTPGFNPLGLDNVQVRAIQSAAGASTPVPGTGSGAGAVTLKLAASVAAGGQQTVQASTGKGASVALVVDYPDGSQLVAPGHAGPDGHYSYSWTLPAGVHGTVKVWLDAGGSIAQGSFTVS